MATVSLTLTTSPDLAGFAGTVVVFADARLDAGARALPKAARAAAERALASEAWEGVKPGQGLSLAFPAGLEAAALLLVRLGAKPTPTELRRAGGALGKALGGAGLLVLGGGLKEVGALAEGLFLRAYGFQRKLEAAKPLGAVQLVVKDAGAAEGGVALARARAEAVHFTRDLTSEPANILTTIEFGERLLGLRDLGLEVELLDEPELEKLGMRTLLAVGQGSESPSRVVVMQWKGEGAPEGAPLALVGKGVVFDTGGISLKPGLGMEEMTMDMGGAGVVAGVMRLLAERRAPVHVVGLVGIVENMPDGRAQRPGDIVTSMKGDTIEVINTDAEGRLVLADVLWYAQERFAPCAMIDLATLTGAIIVGLGNERAGVFGSDDAFTGDFLAAAKEEGEGAWHMPLGAEYDEAIKSRLADIRNSTGRAGGSSTAAAFLQRFVKPGTPWIHLDIAGVALSQKDSDLAPKGASGWGVRSLDTLIRRKFGG